MAEYTEHYNLELPANAEHYDIKVANTNNRIIDEKLYEKVEKIPNKSLSTNDFTNGYKQKLDSLKNYDDTQTKKNISNIQKEQTTQNTDISNIKKEQETQNTNIEENNSKIVELQTEKAKLETELKEMQEDIYQNSIRGQASGEYIHVEDSNGARCKIGISGNSEQETSTQNENLLILEDGTQTLNGVTMTIKDGVITFNGTATASIFFRIKIKEKLKTGDYYHLAAEVSGSRTKNIALGVIDVKEKIKYSEFNGGGGSPFNLTNDEYITYRIWVENGNVINNKIYKCMISKGSEGKQWVKGIPNMPSQDYPSSIKAVGSNVNLFDKDNYIKSKLYINKNENKFSEASMGKSFIFDISKYNKLTISKVSSERFGVFASVDYPQKDGVGTYLQDAATNATSFSYDFAKFNYLVVFYYFTRDTLTEQEILDSIKIVEGTEATPYSKYGQGSVKVTKCNKNILPLENKTSEWDKAQISIINNELTIKPNSSGNLPVVLDGNVYPFSLNKGTTITISWVYKNGDLSLDTGTIGVDLKLDYDDGTTNSLRAGDIVKANQKSTSSQTIKLEKNVKSIHWYVFGWNVTNAKGSSTYNLQLEIGSKATSCEQHEEQSYIMPVQKEMLEDDYFDWDNEEEVHTWNKLVLDGTEDGWLKREVASGEYRFEFPLSVVALNNNQTINILCDKLKGLTADATYLKQEGISASTWVQIYLKEFSQDKTVEDFKNWLKEHPLTTYYKIETPTRLKFTDEQKAVAKELNNARTYKNVTNITTDSKAILSLDYAKDLETLLTSKESEV